MSDSAYAKLFGLAIAGLFAATPAAERNCLWLKTMRASAALAAPATFADRLKALLDR